MSVPAIDAMHISLGTRRSNGEWVATPVWFAALDDAFYVRTMHTSGKVKRIPRCPQVTVTLCDEAGKLLGETRPARARLMVQEEPLIQAAEDALQSKYGAARTEMTRLMESQSEPLVYLEIVFQ
jgi:PPOX class probable F420-dependent enzyme